MHSELAVLAIGRNVLMDFAAGICLRGSIETIKENCRRSVYWPTFCALARAGDVPENFTGNLILSRVVIGWAREGGASVGREAA